MNEVIFSGLARVELQGEEALQFIETDFKQAQYKVLGFEKIQIFITDHRAEGIDAIREVLETENVSNFAERFSSPAYVIMALSENSALQVDLYNTPETHLKNMLWIVVGMPDSMPIYNYHYYHFEPIGQDKYAFISIFSIEDKDQSVLALPSTFAC